MAREPSIYLALLLRHKNRSCCFFAIDCSLVDCFPNILPRDCPKGTLYEENLIWGCCPACVKYLPGGKYIFWHDKEWLFHTTTHPPDFLPQLFAVKHIWYSKCFLLLKFCCSNFAAQILPLKFQLLRSMLRPKLDLLFHSIARAFTRPDKEVCF